MILRCVRCHALIPLDDAAIIAETTTAYRSRPPERGCWCLRCFAQLAGQPLADPAPLWR